MKDNLNLDLVPLDLDTERLQDDLNLDNLDTVSLHIINNELSLESNQPEDIEQTETKPYPLIELIEHHVLRPFEFAQSILIPEKSAKTLESSDIDNGYNALSLLFRDTYEENVFEQIDLLIKICSYLDVYSLVMVSQINHAFLRASKDNNLWKALLKKHFHKENGTGTNNSDLKTVYGKTYLKKYKGLDKKQKYTFTLAKDNNYPELTNNYIDVKAKDKNKVTIMQLGRTHNAQQTLEYTFMCYLLSKVFNDNKVTKDKENIIETILCKAIWFKQPISMLKQLVLQGATVNGKWKNKSALHCAVLNGDEAATNFLLGQGAIIDEVEILGATPLFVAVARDHLSIVNKLLSLNADLTIPLQEGHHIKSFDNRVYVDDSSVRIGDTPLIVAIKAGNIKIVKALIEKGADIYHVVNNLNALHLAAKLGKLEIVKLLVEKSVNINSRSPCGATALIFAAVNKHMDIVIFLVANKADTTIALTAKDNDNIKIDADIGDTILHVAVKLRNRDLIKCLLSSNSVDINIQDELGRSPLHLAVLFDYPDILEQLLSFYRMNVADVDLRDHAGATPLLLATELGNTEIVTLLLKYNADPTIRLKATITTYHELFNVQPCDNPLYISLRIHNKDIFEKILPKITSFEIKNIALSIAAEQGLLEEAKLLLKAGAMVGYSNESGATALFFAVINKYNKMVQMLLDNGADPNIKLIAVDDYFKKFNVIVGDTPLHIAARNQDTDSVHYLLKQEANVEIYNSTHLTPVDIVPKGTRCGDELRLVEYFIQVNRRPDNHHKNKISLFGHEIIKFGAPAIDKKILANAVKNFIFADGMKPKLKDHKQANSGELLKICKRLGIT